MHRSIRSLGRIASVALVGGTTGFALMSGSQLPSFSLTKVTSKYDEKAINDYFNFRPGETEYPVTGVFQKDMESFVLRMQDKICENLEKLEEEDADGESPMKFLEEKWTKGENSYGRTRVMQGGKVFQKAGVNISVVNGVLSRNAAAQMRARGKPELAGDGPFEFFACGISLVIHPLNPHAPTSHANYRFFEVKVPGKDGAAPTSVWWFGGGADVTPSILYEEDVRHFHQTHKNALKPYEHLAFPLSNADKPDGLFYRLKSWCDSYFYIPHRGERRGLGGIFFDDMDNESISYLGVNNRFPNASISLSNGKGQKGSPYQLFPLIQDCAEAFLPSYLPLVQAHKNQYFTEQEHKWQQMRRGRYVEFNVMYDRGTKFGLEQPGSRIESILMSLPLTARWEYCGDNYSIPEEHLELVSALKSPKEWV